jgi:uncharacterized phage protein (TIGR01671 family)
MTMREILFRGKLPDTGEWVEGYVVKGNCTYILTAENIHYMVVSVMGHASVEVLPVIPNTVGQYTGLKDKNGKRIFEGDIIEINGINMLTDGRYCVEFDVEKERAWIMRRDAEHNHGYFTFSELDYYDSKVTEIYATVIGNIHDNPELFEGAITHEE